MDKNKELSEQDIAFEVMLEKLKKNIDSYEKSEDSDIDVKQDFVEKEKDDVIVDFFDENNKIDKDKIKEEDVKQEKEQQLSDKEDNKSNFSISESIGGTQTINLTGQLKIDAKAEMTPEEKKELSRKKLNEFLDSTTDIYSGDSLEETNLFQTSTTSVHKINEEEIKKFRQSEIAESQLLRYREFKMLRSAKADKFVLDTKNKTAESRDKDDKPNINIQLPNPSLYDDQQDEQEFEYRNQEDSQEVASRLAEMKKITLLRSLGLLILGIVSLYSLIAPMLSLPILEVMTVEMPAAYLVYNLVLLLASTALSFPIVFSGIKDMFSLKINQDSMVGLVDIVCIIQTIVLFITGADVLQNEQNVFVLAPLGIWCMLFSCIGRYMLVKRAAGNFEFVGSEEQKYSSGIIGNEDLASAFTRGTVSRKPYVSYNRKSGFTSNFIYYSFLEDITDRFSFYMFPAGLGISLILGIICGYISESFSVALTGFTAGICFSSPLCYMLSVHIPMNRAQVKLEGRGASVLGYEASTRFGNLNAALTSAHKLFPKGTVTMVGMRAFAGGQSIDQSIIDAASVLSVSKSVLRDMFMDVVLQREDLLKEVDTVLFEDTMGVSAWVDNRRVIIGSRQMLINHNIVVPDLDEERRFCPDDCHLIYIAVSGVLNAAFIFSIKGDKNICKSLEQLLENNVYLVVQTVDPVITKETLSEVFSIDEELFKILPARYHDAYNKQTAEVDESDSPVINDGTFYSYVQSIITAKRLYPLILVMLTLSIASVILGIVMLFVLGALNGLHDFGTLKMLVYQIIWVLIILIIPLIKQV